MTRIASPPGTSALYVEPTKRKVHVTFDGRDDVWRDLAGWQEARIERAYIYSTIVFPPFSRAKFPANLVELAAGIEAGRDAAWAAYVNSTVVDDALCVADPHEHEGRI